MAASRDALRSGPSTVYRAKAVITRARSLTWSLRHREEAPALGIPILFYHRVSDERDELAVAPRRFIKHMEYIAARGVRAVDVDTVAAELDRGSAVSTGLVGLCFDDGYRDVAANALPVIERLGFRATVFVATGVIDGTAGGWSHARQPPVLSWAEIGDLISGGVLSFGAHTVNHRNLLTLDDATARAEIVESKVALEARTGGPVNSFCYPAGWFGARERRFVAEAGFTVATSSEPGTNHPDTDRLALRRLQVDRRDALLDVRAKLAGAHDKPLPLRTAWRRYEARGLHPLSKSP